MQVKRVIVGTLAASAPGQSFASHGHRPLQMRSPNLSRPILNKRGMKWEPNGSRRAWASIKRLSLPH